MLINDKVKCINNNYSNIKENDILTVRKVTEQGLYFYNMKSCYNKNNFKQLDKA